MNKFICISILISLFLVSCSNEDDPIPVPPKPPVGLTEDAILGTYETYYYEKQVVVNPGSSNESSYGGLRLTDYDGFRTTFAKENGKYKARDYNLMGDVILEADYHVSNDTIRFQYVVDAKDGSDSIVKTFQHVREFGRTEGIMKLANTYSGTTIYDGVKYEITDAKATRNTKTAPNSTQDMNPAKVMIDFDDMMNGTWHIYSFREYIDGVLDRRYSDLMTDTLSKTSYKFYKNEKGEKCCKLKEWHYGTNSWYEEEFPVVVIDDVIHLLFYDPVLEENSSLFLWVTSWKKRNGNDSFIDLKEQRYTNDVKVIIKTEIYVQRILDS